MPFDFKLRTSIASCDYEDYNYTSILNSQTQWAFE